MDETLTITPVIESDSLYSGEGRREFEATPPGSYRMSLTSNIRVKRTKAGQAKLSAFFSHTDPVARGRYKGVEVTAMLEGTDKNGKSLARQFGDMLVALGISKADVLANAATVRQDTTLSSIPEDEQWKGVPATILLNGDAINDSLVGREAIVIVEANEFNGKVNFRANGIYPAN